MTDSAPKQEPPYGLRMPPDLKARVKAAAEAANRSMNQEIVLTLEEKYPAPTQIGVVMRYAMRKIVEAVSSIPRPDFTEKQAVDTASRAAEAIGLSPGHLVVEFDGQLVHATFYSDNGGMYHTYYDRPEHQRLTNPTSPGVPEE